MRKLILILWAGILSVLSVSCYDDEGSNDYHSINEVKISDWKKGGYTAIFKSDTLKITPLSYLDTVRKEPVIQFTEDSDPSRYEYEWKVVPGSSTGDLDKGIILGTEQILQHNRIFCRRDHIQTYRTILFFPKNKKTFIRHTQNIQ